MHLKTIIVNSLKYNLWANEQYCQWLSDKPHQLLTANVNSSFSSILLTVEHILHTQEYWWSVINEQQSLAVERPETALDPNQIFSSLLENSKSIVDYVGQLDEHEFVGEVRVHNDWFMCNFSKYEYVQQLAYHSAYHRGQIVTIARGLDIVDAPMTDYNFWNLYKDRGSGND